MKLHHKHASLAGGNVKRAPVSFDVAGMRFRVDGGTNEEKVKAVKRLVFCWNMHEGQPTSTLEAGAERAFFDAVQALVNEVRRPHIDFARVLECAVCVEVAWEKAVVVELTADGRRAECPCSEVVR